MKSPATVTALVLLSVLGVGATSYYVTDVQQAKQIERLEQRRKLAELQHARVADLLVREASSSEAAAEVLKRWESRYKYIPNTLNTADMVEYLEGLSRSGFEQFDLFLATKTEGPDFSTYTWNVTGTAFYSDFYHLLWHLENNREFYRVRDLSVKHVNVFKKNRETGVDRRLDMVAFEFALDAYFAGIEGISAPESDLRPIPLSILQAHRPPDASFNPLVRTDLPPNDEQLLDVENADLIAIMGAQAIFEDKYGRHVVLEGDRVYLGEIALIDPVNSFVRVRLNKGDRVETLNVRVGGQDRYRRALGDGVQLEPIDGAEDQGP
ncbi:MAG: hypothetical protein R3362_08615 [Rhodothermales bacterium]|nr:hypothetical protein [Rhodothermales bacterium]